MTKRKLPEKKDHIIEIIDLHKSFEDNYVLRGVNLKIRRGEIMTLIGGSGTGKTVILRSIIGLIRPDQGKVIFNGGDITHYTEEQFIEVRKEIGMLFQGGALFDSLNVLDNVCYPLREHTPLSEDEIRKRGITILEEVGLNGKEGLFPADLSGGMKRRVGIARSIILEPEMILFDEPTTGLDPYNTRNISELIVELNKTRGITSLIVTHDMETALKITDRLAMLYEGRIAMIGTREEIMSSQDTLVKSFISGEALAH
ncbi:MAG: ABC transporter ATP-binding protein [Deltaproteobacteria bacterium]|nr:ABC transporter ATP-binding protein [Deltaproteobacteria bacterium]